MIFLKPAMLVGLGAAVIPLVLHFLNKARYQNLQWGAMMFLPDGDSGDRSGAEWKQGAVLAMRTGIIAGLALALARPVVAGRNRLAADAVRRHAIIILDRSASMAVSDGTHPRMALAKQAAVNVLSTQRRGDEVSLILTGDRADPDETQPTTDFQSVASRIESLLPAYGPANIAAALDQARQTIAAEPDVAHEVFLICDQQASSWNAVDAACAAQWRAAVNLSNSPSRLFVLTVGGKESDNVSLQSIQMPGPPPVQNIPATVELHIRNFGPIPRPALRVKILIDGKAVSQVEVHLAANSECTTTVPVTADQPGSHLLTAKLVDASGMTGDDQVAMAFDVLSPVRVLLVTGETVAALQTGRIAPVQYALMPHALLGSAGGDPAKVIQLNLASWQDASPQRDDVVILNDVAGLSEESVRQLEQFIYAGGGVIFAPGRQTDLEQCNDDLYRESEGFLPASLKAVSAGAAFTVLQSIDAAHPIFGFLSPASTSSAATASAATLPALASIPYTPARQFVDVQEKSADTSVLATFQNGKPAILERPYGRGRVILFTTSLEMDQNDFPRTDFYLPLMQCAVRYLAGSNLPIRNLKPGDPIDVAFDRDPVAPVLISLPDGAQRRVAVTRSGQRWTGRFTDTRAPGPYALLASPAAPPSRYCVSSPREESDPAPLTPSRWTALRQALDFQFIGSEKQAIASAIEMERVGKELYFPIIAVVILMALGEVFLSRR